MDGVDIDPEPRFFQPHVERIFEHIATILLVSSDAAGAGVGKQQPANVSPQKSHQRAVRVVLLISVYVVVPVVRHPPGGRVLPTAQGDANKKPLEPPRDLEAAVAEQSVVTQD